MALAGLPLGGDVLGGEQDPVRRLPGPLQGLRADQEGPPAQAGDVVGQLDVLDRPAFGEGALQQATYGGGAPLAAQRVQRAPLGLLGRHPKRPAERGVGDDHPQAAVQDNQRVADGRHDGPGQGVHLTVGILHRPHRRHPPGGRKVRGRTAGRGVRLIHTGYPEPSGPPVREQVPCRGFRNAISCYHRRGSRTREGALDCGLLGHTHGHHLAADGDRVLAITRTSTATLKSSCTARSSTAEMGLCACIRRSPFGPRSARPGRQGGYPRPSNAVLGIPHRVHP